jgi:hypothetical protein
MTGHSRLLALTPIVFGEPAGLAQEISTKSDVSLVGYRVQPLSQLQVMISV